MEKPCLIDQNEFPDDDVLLRHLGNAKLAYDNLFEEINENYPLYESEWRFYKDGYNWLLKTKKKSKTIFWIAVFPNLFKTTFYFTDKAGDLIVNSDLGQEYKDQFANGKYYGKIKAISVVIQEPANLDNVKVLIEIKEKLK